jgi:hypothetical protein
LHSRKIASSLAVDPYGRKMKTSEWSVLFSTDRDMEAHLFVPTAGFVSSFGSNLEREKGAVVRELSPEALRHFASQSGAPLETAPCHMMKTRPNRGANCSRSFAPQAFAKGTMSLPVPDALVSKFIGTIIVQECGMRLHASYTAV